MVAGSMQDGTAEATRVVPVKAPGPCLPSAAIASTIARGVIARVWQARNRFANSFP